MIDQVKNNPELTAPKELNAKIYPKEYYDLEIKPWNTLIIKYNDKFMKKFRNNNYSTNYLNHNSIPTEFTLLRKLAKQIPGCGDWTMISFSKIIGKDLPLFEIKEIFPLWIEKFRVTSTEWYKYIINSKNIIENRDDSGIVEVTWNDYQQILQATLNNNIIITDRWSILNIRSNKIWTKEISIPWVNFSVLDDKKQRIITHDTKSINILDIKDDLSYTQLQTEDISLRGNLKFATLDKNKNFVICLFEMDDMDWPPGVKKIQQLKIFQFDHSVDLADPNSPSVLIEQDTINDIRDICYVDDNDDVVVLDKDYQVRRIQTNMQEFPVGYKGRAKFSKEWLKVRKAVNKTLEDATALLAKGIKIDTEELATEEEDVDIAKLRHQIWNMSFEEFNNKTLKQLLDTSETVEDLLKVKSIVEAIKRTPEIAAVHGLLDPIESAVFKKYNQAKLDELYIRLDNLANSLGAGEDFNNLLYIQSSLKEIQKDRAQIANIAPTAKDKEIKELTQIVNDKITEYRDSHQEDIQEKIDINLNTIKEYLEGLDYMPQLTSVYNTDVWKHTENMIGYLDEEGKKKNKDAMKSLVKTRQNQLGKSLVDIQKRNQAEEQVKVDEIRNQIGQVKEIIAVIYEEDALKDMEKNDPLVLNIRSAIAAIDSNKSQELIVQLENAFKERILSVKYSKDTTKKWVKSLDKYGIPNSLYFVPEIHKKVRWELMGKQVGDKIKIYFKTNTGTKIEPDINKKILGNFPFQVTQEEFIDIKKSLAERRSNGKKAEFKKLIEEENQLKSKLWEEYKENEKYKKLNEKLKVIEKKYYIPRMLEVMNSISGWMRDLHSRPRVPHLSSKTVIGPSIKKFLEEMGKLLDQQMTYKEWFIIVESEAGTGKNFKIDILAHMTNRELFHISCNQSMEKEDLLFSPELNAEWSFKQKSELIRWLQTPGSIILLDEINTLRPGIAKLLNPLLAGQRYINDPQLGRIYADSSVLIVGLMNPRYYLWTSDIAQEFLDRARIVNDDYPEELEEGFIVSKYIDGPVSQMTYEEFENFRNKYIVHGEVPNDKKIYNMFIAISQVMKVARKIRELYSKTMKGEADMDKELKFVFSIRAGNFILQDFNNSKNIKKSMEDVIMPKVTDSSQKKMVHKIVDEVCK